MESTTPDTPSPATKWAVLKDRLAIGLVIVSLLALVFFMVDGSIVNMRCSFWQFVTFECNRWDARWKPWD
jgi:hypothetical protein